jgi:general secretion pathway protein J
MTRQRGLTLPELLVALLIFALVATATAFALRLGVEARDQLTASEGRLAEMQVAAVLMRKDFSDIRLRPVRDEFGDVSAPPFAGGGVWRPRNEPEGERRLIAFVRAGWDNPGADAPRSSLQYVEYLEKDGALVRRIRPFLDDARGQPRFDRALIRDIRNINVRFLAGEVRGELDWVEAWPPPGVRSSAPMAVSVSFSSSRYGDIERRFWIGEIRSAGPAE